MTLVILIINLDQIYATFIGLATNATNLQVGSNNRTGDVSATNNTVAVRDPKR